MKNLLLPFIFFLLLCGWIIWGGITMTGGCCGAISGLSVLDGGTKVAASAASNFHFGPSGHQALALPSVKGEMQEVANYLTANPDRQVTIEGVYSADEANNSGFGNLGLGRANGIMKYLVGLGAPAAQMIAGSKIGDLAFDNDKTYGGINWTFNNMVRGISFIDGTSFNNSFADDFQFSKSNADYSTPISPGLTTTISKTAEYLKKAGNRAMLITGYYMDGEENSSILPDLGLARANAIKKSFTDLGVPGNLINISSEKRSLDFGSGISTAATYSFGALEASGDRLKAVEARLRAKPLILYFQTGKNNLNLSAEQRQYLVDLMYYLDNKQGASVTSTGHTDNVGNAGANTRLSLKRAEFARDYLTKNNINGSQIKVDGKGPSTPTATNDTAEGRAKNRRVELTIN